MLEATLLGPQLLFRQAAIVAVTGAEAAPKLNGKPQPRNESFAVRADDRLGFDFMRAGARIYIAIAGGIDVPPVLGSRSNYVLGALGGFAGRKLAAGDVLSTGAAKPSARVAARSPPTSSRPIRNRSNCACSPASTSIASPMNSAKSFFEDTWTVPPEADRIGYRFRKGRPLVFRERKQPFGAGS